MSTNVDDDDGPPPLEDLTEEINAALNLKHSMSSVVGKTNLKSSNSDKTSYILTESQNTETNGSVSSQNSVACLTENDNKESDKTERKLHQHSEKSSSKSAKADFGGMNKGFLFGGSPKKQTKPKSELPKKKEEMPVIKSNPENTSLKFEEVQKTQNETPNWINDSLLNTVTNDNTLMNKLNDPKYAKVLEEFQKDPKAAMAKYADDKDVAEFFKSFMGIFGDHFSKMFPEEQKTEETPLIQEISSESRTVSKPKSAAEVADERKMQEILSRPDVRKVLQSPDVQNLIHLMRNDPNEGQKLLLEKRTDETFQNSVRVLCDNGLLQFAS